MSTLFKSFAEALEKVEATRSRLKIIELAADFLKSLKADEVEPAVSLMLGRPFPKSSQKKLDVSWATLSDILQKITGTDWSAFSETFTQSGDIGQATRAVFERTKPRRQAVLFRTELTILEVRRSLEAIAEASGSGSREKKERLITALLGQASPAEAKFLVKIFTGEMRTGFQEGLMEQTVAKAFQVPLNSVQTATMALGDIGEVAVIAKTSGEVGLQKVGFQVFRPVKLMLATVADEVKTALDEHGGKTAFEYKYDGARVQIHKKGKETHVFSRRLTDVTESLPEVVAAANEIAAKEVIVEGEVVAVDNAGAPIPFQHLMRRFKRIHGITNESKTIPLRLYLFDVLYLNGQRLTQLPYLSRREILSEISGKIPLSVQLTTSSVQEAQSFLEEAIKRGHEGVMAKRLDSPYFPGVRGSGWLKVKPVLDPLDLVITAAEWGYGRRHNWLSDYYLAARDAETGEFLEVGKTFKGLTDFEFAEMTKRLKADSVSETVHRVIVVPKIVVEVAYNEIQQSPKYRSEMALRFARITRIREDKSPQEADTIQRVRAIYERQFAKKGRYKTTKQ